MVVKTLGLFLLLSGLAIFLFHPSGTFVIVLALVFLGQHLLTKDLTSSLAVGLWSLLIISAIWGIGYLLRGKAPW